MNAIQVLVLFVGSIVLVSGHGRLMDPPNRSSLWRIDPLMLPNHHDDQLWCGGVWIIHEYCNLDIFD